MVLNALFGRASLDITCDRFTLKRQVLGWQRVTTGNTSDLESVSLKTLYTQNDHPVQVLALQEGVHIHRFGSTLTQPEQSWLMAELESFIQDQNRQRRR